MEDRFRRSISELSDLMADNLIDKIIFATETGSLKNKEKLRNYLRRHEVDIIESHSRFSGRGTEWYQMQDLDAGLEHVQDNATLLKTRSDIHINKPFIRSLFTGGIDHLHRPAGSGVFKNRIWAPFFGILTLFMISDYCFWGHKEDIEKLFNYDARYDVKYDLQKGIAATRRYIHPYLDKYPFLNEYLTHYRGYNRHPDFLTDRNKFVQSRLESPQFCDFLGFYYKTMLEDFYVNYEPVKMRDRDSQTHFEIFPHVDKASSTEQFMTNFEGGPNQGRRDIICTHTSWLQAHFCDPRSTHVPEQILTAFDRSYDAWKDYDVDSDQIEADVRREDTLFRNREQQEMSVNPMLKTIADRLLAPLGLKKYSRRLYHALRR
jgi:hypothetical protein